MRLSCFLRGYVIYIISFIFSLLASEIKKKVALAGMDLTQEGNDEVGRMYEIERYPTMEYFEAGKHKFRYPGENTKVLRVPNV